MKLILVVLGVSAVLPGAAFAANAAKMDAGVKTTKVATGPKPVKMTCEEFVALDEVTRPKLVYWAEGFNRKGKSDEAVFDVNETDSLVPVLVEDCTNAPKESFWKKAKAEFKKVF